MRLGVFNCDKRLLGYMPKTYELVYLENEDKLPDIDSVLIDWIPRYVKDKNKLATQAAVVDFYASSKKPVVLFDRYLDIIEREFNYLKKFNVFFFEPAINHREGFSFLPPWTEEITIKDLPHKDNGKKEIDLGHIGTLKNRLKGFEAYYIELSEHFPKYNVHYTASLPKHKVDEYKNAGVTKKDFSWNDLKCFVLIDTPNNYEIGYLNPDVFDAMYMGSYPLLPEEHRFYHSVFPPVKNIMQIALEIDSYYGVQEIVLLDIYKNISKVFPEMIITNTVDVIRKCVEK